MCLRLILLLLERLFDDGHHLFDRCLWIAFFRELIDSLLVQLVDDLLLVLGRLLGLARFL